MAKKTKEEQKRLVLLDAHAIIHRAYHAIPDFTGPSGEPTGALYGLASMLLKIITDLKPDYLAACYDLPKPTHRHEAYEAYKGTRAKTEPELVSQLSRSRAVFEAFSIPIYEREGFEADDILGTIARELKKSNNVDVVIASGDMDTLQLVDDERVRVYTLKKGLSDTILYDEEAVKARYGFSPVLIPDWKGLRGDPSDNIIGIPGIGEKIATDLVARFGSIEEIYKVLEKDENILKEQGVKSRVIELLKAHKEDALFSKMLATIRTDAPIAFSLPRETWKVNGRLEKVFALFDELGFRSLKQRARSVFGARGAGQEGLPSLEEEPAPDSKRFAEAQVMLWLLASDFTNPSLEDIRSYTKTKSFDEAYDALTKKIKETGKLHEVYEKIEKPLIPVVRKMEQRGVLVDHSILEELSTRYHAELAEISERIYKAAGHPFNLNSPRELGAVLFDELALLPKNQKRTALGQRSTKESELEKVRDAHPVVADILEYREVQKLLSTYIDALPPLLDETGRLHAHFLQTGTTTGRMASQNPNLQNIPIRSERGRAIRRAFAAPSGFVLVALDYSQIELRIAAVLSGDEKLGEIFRSGRDVHREVAAEVFRVPPEEVNAEMRRRAKIINFGILYGMGIVALKQALGTSMAEARAFHDDYFSSFPMLAEHLEHTKGFARRHGYTETLFGRRRLFEGIRSPLPYVRAQAERMAVNAPIQGTQSDIIKLAMVEVDTMLAEKQHEGNAHLILQVHDELVYEVRKEHAEVLGLAIQKLMENVVPLEKTRGIPLSVLRKCGDHWDGMEGAP